MDISLDEADTNDIEVDATKSPSYPPLPQMLDPEWHYEMRRSMQEIIPNLYLGPYNAACKSKLQQLLDEKITHIICVRGYREAHFIRPNFPDQFNYLVLDIADTPGENIIPQFGIAKKFIDEALEHNGRVLVHGNAGISRCATLVLAYLMETYGLGHSEAFSLAQLRRFCINPSDRLMLQLKEFEPIYRAQKFKEHSDSDLNKCKKRTLQEMDVDREFDDKTIKS